MKKAVPTPFTADERQALIRSYWEVQEQLSWPNVERQSDEQAAALTARRDQLLVEYASRLPHLAASACPLCGEKLAYPFDPFGFDGPWWAAGALAEDPPPHGCAHFRVLLGAVNVHRRPLTEAAAHSEVWLGPEVPFVVPRLLNLPGMRAALAESTLASGDTAYLIAYFSPAPIHGALLHQPWARAAYAVIDKKGRHQGWTRKEDGWDFDLAPWIEQRRLGWIEPGDPRWEVRFTLPCLFDRLPGHRAPQVIERGVLRLRPLPSGAAEPHFE